MAFFEVSSLVNFNIRESFCELSRRALHRNGMERLWRSNRGKYLAMYSYPDEKCHLIWSLVSVLSLQELCCKTIVSRTTVYGIDQLPLPELIKSHLKSYALTSVSPLTMTLSRNTNKKNSRHCPGGRTSHHPSSPQSLPSETHCGGRNSCRISWL